MDVTNYCLLQVDAFFGGALNKLRKINKIL